MKRSLTFICRIIIAGIFLYAGIGKIADPSSFADSVAAYRILPRELVNAFALVLPWTEVLAACALFLPALRRQGALVLTGLCTIFILAVISAMARGLNIDCGCFAKASTAVGARVLARDVVLLAMCVVLMLEKGGEVRFSGETRGHLPGV